MDKVEEILPRITEFIKFELAKESLSPLAERTRLYYVERIEAVLEQSGDRCNGHAEKQASTSFLSTAPTFHDSTSLASTVPQPESETSSSSDFAETQSVPVAATDAISPAASGCESWSGRRTSVIHGNVVTNPFRKPSVDTLTDKRTNFEFHNSNFHSMEGAYETLPCDQNDSYQVFNSSDDNLKCSSNVDISGDISGVNGETSDFNDTDFENSEDEMPTTYTAKTPSGNHFVSMPSLSSLLTSNKSSKNADLSNRTFGGELHQKGVLGQYTKRFCAISGSDFLCCKSEKEPKLVLMFPLSNCHVLYQEKDGKLGHELKFVIPNLPNYMFYTENKEAALLWMQEITKVRRELNGEAGKFPTEEQMPGTTDDADLQSVSTQSSENISGGSYEKAMAQKADSDTSSDNKKKSKIQTFLGTFGRKRGNKLKLLAATSDENFISQDALIGGYVKVYCEGTTNKKWLKRFCTVQGGNLYCKRDMMEERPELVFPLPGAEMSLAEKESKKELTIKLVRKDMELCLEIADSSEHGQWVQVLLNETGFANQLNRNSKILNTINVAGQDSNIDSRKNNVPRLPSSSPPITPPVGREVRDKHSEPIYIEPLSPTSPDSFDFTDDSFAPDGEPAGESIYMNLCTLTGEPLTNDFSAISDPANNNNSATNAITNEPAQPANGVPNASSGKGRVENVQGGTTPLSSHKNETQSTGKVPIPKKPTNVTITKSLEKLSGSNDPNRNKIAKVNSHPVDVKPGLQVKPATGRLSDVGLSKLKPEIGLKVDNARWCSDLNFVADCNNSESSDKTWTVSNAMSVEYTKPFKASLGISKSTESSTTSGVESRPIKFSPAPSNHDTVSDSIESAPVLNNNKPALNKTSIVMERVKLFETTSQAATS